MDNQCDRCGRELRSPIELGIITLPDDRADVKDRWEGCVTGFHIVVGSYNFIFADGELDWDPDEEVDLCEECKEVFLKLWRAFYDVRVVHPTGE